jgi:hypothetical protein
MFLNHMHDLRCPIAWQKVPRECHDAVSVLVHQFQLYQGSINALMAQSHTTHKLAEAK